MKQIIIEWIAETRLYLIHKQHATGHLSREERWQLWFLDKALNTLVPRVGWRAWARLYKVRFDLWRSRRAIKTIDRMLHDLDQNKDVSRRVASPDSDEQRSHRAPWRR